MEDKTRIQQLESQVQELLQWKASKERQQLIYPLDQESLPALTQHYMKKGQTDNSSVTTRFTGLGNTTLVDAKVLGSRIFNGAISVGDETADKQGASNAILNGVFQIQHQPDDASFNSFVYAYRNPIYTNPSGTTVSVSSGGTTVTDTTQNWTVNALAGAMISINDGSGNLQFTRQIASNTATVITIDGTWPATVNNGNYVVLVPLYLGAVNYPWRRLIVGGNDVSSAGDGSQRRAISLGYGTTGGTETLGIFFGTGDPVNVITANIGSLYLRTDGGAGTTLYVKEADNGAATGWSSTA